MLCTFCPASTGIVYVKPTAHASAFLLSLSVNMSFRSKPGYNQCTPAAYHA